MIPSFRVTLDVCKRKRKRHRTLTCGCLTVKLITSCIRGRERVRLSHVPDLAPGYEISASNLWLWQPLGQRLLSSRSASAGTGGYSGTSIERVWADLVVVLMYRLGFDYTAAIWSSRVYAFCFCLPRLQYACGSHSTGAVRRSSGLETWGKKVQRAALRP